MKKLMFIMLVAMLPLAAGAQARFGYLSYGDAVKAMPEYAEAQRSLAGLKAQYEAETKRSEDEFNAKYQDFLQGQKTFATSILKKRQAELQELMLKGVQFKQEAQRLLAQAEADIYAPLYKKLDAILAKIGAERGYEFILNTDNHALPYINPAAGEDITGAVKSAFGK